MRNSPNDSIASSVNGNQKGQDNVNGNHLPLQFRAKQLSHVGMPWRSVDSTAGKRIMVEAWPSAPARTRQRCSTAKCQVAGCNADLRNGKDYHRRHKVCEIHSKAPRVELSGLEQRFCQQCSRFHVLSEFDEDKRSCRRRLAGHNERRRKSQALPDLSFPFQGTEGSSASGSAASTLKQSRDTGTGRMTLPSAGVDLPSGLDLVRVLSLLSPDESSSIYTSSSAVDNNFERNSLARECLHRPPQRRDGLQQMNIFEHAGRAAPLDTPGRWDSFPIPCLQCSESKRIPDLSCRTFGMDFLQ